MPIQLSEQQARTIIEDLETRPAVQAHTQVWSRRSYAPMLIHSSLFEDVRLAIREKLPDYEIAFDVVFESKGGEVAYHCDYESLGPFIVPSRWRAVVNSHFMTVHFNLTEAGGALVTNSSVFWAYLCYIAIATAGIFSWAHSLILKLAPLQSNQRVHPNTPRIGNIFDNTRMHMVTAGRPRISYVVRLVKKGGCVFVSRDSFTKGASRSAACSVFQSLGESLTSDRNEDAGSIPWASYMNLKRGAD